MKAIIQRVTQASVSVDGDRCGSIGPGFVVLLGVTHGDTADDARLLAHKTINLRVFRDAQDRMNLALEDVAGSVLVVSQFTLYADTRKGNRPSFINAAEPAVAESRYTDYIAALRAALGGARVQTGRFGAHMQLEIHNDGPVTIELTTDRPHGLPTP
jgi:D-aminoacyl-tRNA deacylase